MEKEIIKILKVTSKGKKFIVSIDTNDEEYKFSENEIVSNRIIKGALFTKEEWDQIINNQSKSLLFDQMLHFIDYKLRTKKEVRDKLKEKKASIEETEEIIVRLENIGYLDDERYTSIYVQEALRDLKGPYLIKYTLEQKGIESSLINEALDNLNSDILLENAKVLANRYQKTILNHPENKQKELIMQKLARSGFYMDMINKVVREINFEADDIEKLEEEYEKLKNKTDDKNKIITSLIQKGYKYPDIKRVIKDYQEYE